jgi:hypothetical protein
MYFQLFIFDNEGQKFIPKLFHNNPVRLLIGFAAAWLIPSN